MLIDCEAAIVPWGSKAKFKRARMGLTRSNLDGVRLMVHFTNEQHKFPINGEQCQLMPAALRLKHLKTDVFVRNPLDEMKLKLFLRKIRIVIEQDKLRYKGKGHVVDEILGELPSHLNMGQPIRATARIKANPTPNSCDNPRASTSMATSTTNTSSSIAPIGGKKSSLSDPRLDNLQLKVINIEGPIAKIPCNLWSPLRVKWLVELRLVHCGLCYIPKQLAECFGTTLRSLDLSHNEITHLSGQFCCYMQRLTHLTLGHNNLQRLPLEIRFLRHLKCFDLSFNQLETLPSTFTDLTELVELSLSNNQLHSLPAFCERSVRLRRLDVSHNPLNCASGQEFYQEDEQFFKRVTRLEYLALLSIASSERAFRLAHSRLPPLIYSLLQSKIFKCFSCARLSVGAAYHLVDILDYISQVEVLETNGNLHCGMSFVKTICYRCFVGKHQNAAASSTANKVS